MNLIAAYVEALPPIKRNRLYESPWTCQALLRALPPVARQYVLRLLFIDEPVPAEYMANWCHPKDLGKHTAALDSLCGLEILKKSQDESAPLLYFLDVNFKKQLRSALCGGGQVAPELPVQVQQESPSMEELDGYAQQQWQAVQMYILSDKSLPPQLATYMACEPLNIFSLMQAAGLVTGSKSNRSVSDQGFRFLLMGTNDQLWTILRVYITEAEQKPGAELTGVMSFLMQLGFRRVGQPVALATLTPLEQNIAAHMMQLGLLTPFQVDRRTYFCPTRLAASLCGGGGGATGGDSAVSGNASGGGGPMGTLGSEIAGGYIVVETNYRVYAYTRSPVQTAILELFCRTDCTLPNLFVGTLTRESVGGALRSGIVADEIATYLRQHAHPHVAARNPIVPEVVTDQLRLWQADLNRVQANEVYVYDNFESPELFAASLDFATNQGWVLWQPEPDQVGRMAFAVRANGHEGVRDYIKMLKQKGI